MEYKPCEWCQHPTDKAILWKHFKYCGLELCGYCFHKKNKLDRIAQIEKKYQQKKN